MKFVCINDTDHIHQLFGTVPYNWNKYVDFIKIAEKKEIITDYTLFNNVSYLLDKRGKIIFPGVSAAYAETNRQAYVKYGAVLGIKYTHEYQAVMVDSVNGNRTKTPAVMPGIIFINGEVAISGFRGTRRPHEVLVLEA